MYKPNYTKQFEKDLKKSIEAGKNVDELKKIIQTLLKGESLKSKI